MFAAFVSIAASRGFLRLRSAGVSLRSECVTLLIFSTLVMLSGSAAQAAVESKHPVSACDAATLDTFSATTCRQTVS